MTDQENAEAAVRGVLERIERAWQRKQFDGLAECFAEDAVIVGPGYATFACGRDACAESYREFATNASVLDYTESDHRLRIWGATAVHTFSWSMTYQREGEAKKEAGTDQLVLSLQRGRWQVAFRYINFSPST